VLPRVAFILSKDALAVYFIHLLLVYGIASTPFMFPSYIHGMSPLQVGCWIGGLILAMTAMAYGIGWLRINRTAVLVYGRHAVILAGILSFALWLEMTVVRVGISAAISVAVVLFVHRARLSVGRDRESLVRTE
jgi:surface polysaccharide O-acyltransferase-like enzyme